MEGTAQRVSVDQCSIGQEVEVLRSNGTWALGTILEISMATMTVVLKDKSKKHIPTKALHNQVRLLQPDLPQTHAAPDKYCVGQEIEVLRGGGSWSPATILEIEQDMVHVSMKDGGKKHIPSGAMHTQARLLHPVEPSQPQATREEPSVGQAVFILRHDGSWSPGIIAEINPDDVAVRLEDGGKKRISADKIGSEVKFHKPSKPADTQDRQHRQSPGNPAIAAASPQAENAARPGETEKERTLREMDFFASHMSPSSTAPQPGCTGYSPSMSAHPQQRQRSHSPSHPAMAAAYQQAGNAAGPGYSPSMPPYPQARQRSHSPSNPAIVSASQSAGNAAAPDLEGSKERILREMDFFAGHMSDPSAAQPGRSHSPPAATVSPRGAKAAAALASCNFSVAGNAAPAQNAYAPPASAQYGFSQGFAAPNVGAQQSYEPPAAAQYAFPQGYAPPGGGPPAALQYAFPQGYAPPVASAPYHQGR